MWTLKLYSTQCNMVKQYNFMWTLKLYSTQCNTVQQYNCMWTLKLYMTQCNKVKQYNFMEKCLHVVQQFSSYKATPTKGHPFYKATPLIWPLPPKVTSLIWPLIHCRRGGLIRRELLYLFQRLKLSIKLMFSSDHLNTILQRRITRICRVICFI